MSLLEARALLRLPEPEDRAPGVGRLATIPARPARTGSVMIWPPCSRIEATVARMSSVEK